MAELQHDGTNIQEDWEEEEAAEAQHHTHAAEPQAHGQETVFHEDSILSVYEYGVLNSTRTAVGNESQSQRASHSACPLDFNP